METQYLSTPECRSLQCQLFVSNHQNQPQQSNKFHLSSKQWSVMKSGFKK
uniref:Uncharacterized protein n=1 Tax=Tetranychus urticae TaxID=32264 RepID=T1L125_TETUR